MAVTKITKKFTEKKQEFISSFDDPKIFDCADFNIIKLYQYAIFREEGFNARVYWTLPVFIINLIFFIKRLRIKRIPKISYNPNVKVFISDNGPTLKLGTSEKSRYFHQIIDKLNNNYLYCDTSSIKRKTTIHHISVEEYYPYFSVLPINDDDKYTLKHLKKTYKNIISKTKINNNKKQILKEIIEIFWRRYRVYRKLLEYYPNLKIAFTNEHYQYEYMFYALKRRGVKIIELQHGLIANEDMFYVYDKKILKVKEKALFADEMWVYGQYWKDTLLNGYEYDEKQIKIFGYYLYYEKNFSDAFQQEINKIKQKYPFVIFATAQKNLEKHLAEYINFLLQDAYQKSQKFALIIKEHPSATQSTIDFINVPKENVFVMNYPIEWLFQVCDAHFSIYSTTLYDALMFNIQHNFALKHPLFSDYVESIVNKGIAIELLPTENLLDKISASNTTIPPLNVDYFYSPANFELLKEYTENL